METYTVWVVVFGVTYNRISHWLTFYNHDDACQAAHAWRALGDTYEGYGHFWADMEARER